MEYGDFQDSYQGFASKPFNPDFRIPKAVTPMQSGASRAPPLFPPPPPPPMLFQSPMATFEESFEHTAKNYYQDGSQSAKGVGNGLKAVKKDFLKRKPFNFLSSVDADLPEELRKLFNALHCTLCDAKMNSPISARMHYESKQHDKKVNQWLADWSQRTGEPLPKRQKLIPSSLSGEGPKGPNAFFCEHCQIPLTSAQHANQHFTGKRHRMVAAGKMCPKGSGYYDKDGNWIKQNKPVDDPSGRFGIGSSFLQASSTDISLKNLGTEATLEDEGYLDSQKATIGPALIPTQTETNPTSQKSVTVSDPSKYCAVCNISVTSEQQMAMHITGARHKKNSAKLSLSSPPPPPPSPSLNLPIPSQPPIKNETYTECYNSQPQPQYGRQRKQDFSIYRTPSGQYYCQHCNITAPNEANFANHINSKSHSKATKSK